MHLCLSWSSTDQPSIIGSSHPGSPYNRFIHVKHLNQPVCVILDSQSSLNDQASDPDGRTGRSHHGRTDQRPHHSEASSQYICISLSLHLWLSAPHLLCKCIIYTCIVNDAQRSYIFKYIQIWGGKQGNIYYIFPCFPPQI